MKNGDWLRYIKPKKTSPENTGSAFDSALNAAKTAVLYSSPLGLADLVIPDEFIPQLLGFGAETAGNAFQTLGDPNRTLAAGYNPTIAGLLRGMGDTAQDFADSAFEYGKSRVQPQNSDEYSGSARNAYDSNYYNVWGGLASMLHSDKAADAFLNSAQNLQDRTPIEPALSWNYLTDPHGFTRSVSQMLGSMGAIMPSMMMVPESAPAAVAGGITRALINRGLYGAAKAFAPRGSGIMRYAMTSPWVEAASEGGFTRRDALEQGMSEDEATRRSINTALANVPVLMGSNFAEGLLLGLPFLSTGSSALAKAMQGLARWQLNAAQQGLEEGTQRGIQDWQLGNPYSFNPFDYSPGQAQEALEGYAGSLPLGVAPAISHVASNRNQTAEQRDYERGSRDNLSPDAYGKRSRYAQTRRLADPASREGIIYLGENGDGEGKYWERNPSMGVSFDGAQPDLLNAVDALGKFYYDHTGKKLVVTAGTNGDHPSNGSEHGHDAGWKVDIVDAGGSDVSMDEDGPLTTRDFRKGSFADEFIAYGRSLGLGMNWEGDGTSNVHIDVALDGTQWDGNGDHAGGFNPRGARPAAPNMEFNPRSLNNDSYDSNFSDRQNEIWQMAQYASQRLRDEHNIRLSPELIYRQWVLEDGGDFTHSSRNWGGLKDTSGNFRTFNSDKEYADAYVDDFMRLRPEINDVTDENGMASDKDFTDVMLKTGYITQGDYDNYINGLPNISAPKSGYGGRANTGGSRPATPSQTQQETPAKPLFDLNAEDNATQKLFERFARERYLDATDPNNPNVGEINFFNGFFDNDGNFQNTQENRDAIRQNYGDEFTKWATDILKQQKPAQPAEQKSSAKPEQNRRGNQYLNNAPIIQAGREFLTKLRDEGKDRATVIKLQQAIGTGDVATVKNILNQHGVEIHSQQTPPSQNPVENNTTPENVLEQPSKQQTSTANEKLIKAASAPFQNTNGKLVSKDARKKIGNAIIRLANQHKIEIPDVDFTALQNGSSKKLQEWQDKLRQSGAFNVTQQTQPAQTQAQPAQEQPTPEQTAPKVDDEIRQAHERARQIIDEQNQAEARKEQKIQTARNIGNNLMNSSEADENVYETVLPESSRQGNAVTESPESITPRERQAQRVEEINQKNEERARQAKQDKELQELQARQAEEKRLRDEAAAESERKTAERRAASEQARNGRIREALGIEDGNKLIEAVMKTPDRNENGRRSQGYALRQLLAHPITQKLTAGLNISRGLTEGLKHGSTKAIETAQKIIADNVNPETVELRGIRPTQKNNTGAENSTGERNEQSNEPSEHDRRVESERRAREQKKRQRQYELERRKEKEQQERESADRQRDQEQELLDAAFAPVSQNKQERINQGKALVKLLLSPKFQSANSSSANFAVLKDALLQGKEKAILKAQQLLSENSEPEATRVAREKAKREAAEREAAERAETDAIEDEFQFEDEMQESRMNRAEDFEDLFGRESDETQSQPESKSETRNEQLQREDDHDAFDLLPDENELNDVDDEIPQTSTQQPNTPKGKPRKTPAQHRAERAKQKIGRKPQQSETTSSTIEGIDGKQTIVITQSKKKYSARYRVVEAGDLITSHEFTNLGVFKNDEYTQKGGIQPRDRMTDELQANLLEQANNLDPDLALNPSFGVNDGAVVVRNDGVVFNGNGRTMALTYAYNDGKADVYKHALMERADQFGLNANRIARMKNPVLIRELTDDLTQNELIDIAGTTAGGAASVADEQAFKDAKKITPQTLAKFPKTKLDEPLDLAAPKFDDFAYALLKDIATLDELSALSKNSKLTQDGRDRVKNALFALAYGDPNLVETMTTSTDDVAKNVTAALNNAAVEFAAVRAKISSGELADYDLAAISDAVIKLAAIRKGDIHGVKTVKDYLETTRLGEQDSDEMRQILSALDNLKRSQPKLTQFLNDLARRMQSKGVLDGGLFGAAEPTPMIDLIKKARNTAENRGETDLFAQQSDARYDITGDKTKINIDTSNIVAEKDLTPAQKLLVSFGKKLGVEVVFFDNPNGKFRGVHKKGKTYLNVNSDKPLGAVFWHESFHWLRNNNPELYKALVKTAGISDAQRQAYLSESKRTDLETPDEIDEEILCDMMDDVAKRTGLLQSIAGKNRGLVERVVQWLKDTLNKFIDHFRNPQGKLTTKQAQALADEFGRIANQLEDPNGQKIFRYNRRTLNIELADGRDLSEATLDEMTHKGAHFPAKYTFNKKGTFVEINESVPFANLKEAREIFKQAMIALKDVPIVNKATGIVAQVGKNGRRKPLSSVAIDKSLANGYSVEQHFTAAMNIKKLYENAWLAEENADKNNESNVISVKRFHCKTIVGGEKAIARITAKEIMEYGHRIYTIELQELNKPAELKDSTGDNPSAGSKGSTITHHISGSHSSEEPSDETITQSERGNKPKFSIGASDNSTESFLQRLRNKMPAWIAGNTDLNERRNKKITRLLSELTGYKIAFGHVAVVDDTIIDDMQKVIRTRHGNDWANLLPAVGKKVAQSLELDATPEMSNYIADFILTGAPNNTSAESKAFAKAARDNPEIFAAIKSVRDVFQEIADMTPHERVRSKIVSESPKNSLIERIGEIYRGGKEQWLDDLDPIKQMLTRIRSDLGDNIADEIEKSIDPYKAARLYKGAGGIVEIIINGKAKHVENIRAALQTQYPNVNFEYFKPLETIIDEAGGLKNLQDFEDYCLAKLTKEIYEHNRAHPEKYIKPAFSEADCDAIIKADEAKFDTAQKDLVNFSRTLLSMMYDAGLISDKKFFAMLNSWENYVPMARVFDEDEQYDFTDSLKQRTGSERDIFSPIQKLISNANEFVKQAERNKVKCTLATLARCGGFGEFVEEVGDNKPSVKDTVTFYENGKRKYLQTDPAIVRALNNLQTQSDGIWITKIISAATGFIRSAYTMTNLDYAAGNIFRDTADAFIHNKYYGTKARPWLAFVDAWHGAMSMIKRDADYYDWLASGGSQSALVSPDINYTQRTIDSITKTRRERWFNSGVTGFFSQVLGTMQKVSEYSEYATRIGTFKRAKSALASQQSDGKATLTDKRNAALMSREATIDFAKAGRSARVINRYAAFFNAAIQGHYRTMRTFNPLKLKTSQGRKELFGAAVRLAMTAVLPAIITFAWNYSDDDRRKKYNQRHDWEKETYWIFGDGFRVPKGMDFSIRLASALTDEFLASWADDKPLEAKRFAQTLKDSAPSLTATIVTPIIEAAFNRSWFRDAPIVPVREQRLPAHMQFGADTSPVAKFFGEQTGFSPRKIDYLINGYLGFMGRFFSNPSLDADKLPMVRRFVFDPYKNPRIVKDYYEAYDEQTALANEYKLTKKKPADYDAALHGRLKSAHEQMNKLSRQERALLEDPKISSDERTKKLRELEKRRIALCERVFAR